MSFMAIIARRLRGFLLFLLVAGLDDLRAQDAANLTLLKDAAQSILAGELDQAEAQLHMVLLKNPDEFHALNFLGVIRAQQQKAGEAEALFKQVIA